MVAEMETPEGRRDDDAREAWETDPEAWKDDETPSEAVERLLEEVASA